MKGGGGSNVYMYNGFIITLLCDYYVLKLIFWELHNNIFLCTAIPYT
jgi:hypothetical protein